MAITPEDFEKKLEALKKDTNELCEEFEEFDKNPEFPINSPEYYTKARELQQRNRELQAESIILEAYLDILKGD